MSSGKVVEIIGAVVDVQFPMSELPKVYEALKIEEANLTWPPKTPLSFPLKDW